MAVADLVDYSPQQPVPAPKLANASKLILIDNYDSFTWNVYQYLVLEGASVTVYRNDQVSLEFIISQNPTQLVISPGPGHPDNDAGISCELIKHFSGKIPILGVCMGEQCIFAAFGGKVDVTGEILHGKTSPLAHDGKGIYHGLAQNLPVTRYHSLAGTHATLPECLEVTSWISKGPDGGKGIIMGVRHKEFLVEGVQFHPESILTAEGRTMLKTFLKMRGGTWAENREFETRTDENGEKPTSLAVNGSHVADSKESILEKIYRHRRAAVAAQKQIPSLRPSDLREEYELGLAPPQISLVERMRSSPYSLSLMAEIKRASPSKGEISMSISAPAQARKYALAGASVISVLTEPEWFKGTIEDLRAVRRAIDGMPNRPAILRKEFVFDEYQILEARLAGADTVLLIVKMLDQELLERLYKYSKELGMEPLVEVNTEGEMKTALELGAKVIGVNNRNLTNFEVDLETTSRLMSNVPADTMICALSGISGAKDVAAYKKSGVKGVLVGEALMRADDVESFVKDLLGGEIKKEKQKQLLVKICGTRTVEGAEAAIKAGADMIGMILVENRKRTVSQATAMQISKLVHSSEKVPNSRKEELSDAADKESIAFFENSARILTGRPRPLLVGVFQNQPLSYVIEQQALLDLDIVQLHGDEPIEWASLIPVPVIRRFGPNDLGLRVRGQHFLPLLDSAAGGTGQTVDKEAVQSCLKSDSDLRVILAGGLNPGNISEILGGLQTLDWSIAAVDVSSGVEKEGAQDPELINEFVKRAKAFKLN